MDKNQKKSRWWSKIKFEPQYLLFAISSMILLVFVIAFTRPVYPVSLEATVQPTCSTETSSQNELTATPTPQLEPPTPEEIGYTDGIIFLATVLVFILVIGTIRETWRRKGD